MLKRELLERSARAAGIPGEYSEEWDGILRSDKHDQFGRGELWRPHTDDGETFRLVVSLQIEPHLAMSEKQDDPVVRDLLQKDVLAATRWAVLLTAAEMDRMG